MKNLSTLMENEKEKPKDYKSEKSFLDIASRLSRLDIKTLEKQAS